MGKTKKSYVNEVPIPESEAEGNDSEHDIIYALGDAVQGWSELEDKLAHILYAFAGGARGGPGPLAAVRAFGAVEAFYMKRMMLRAAATVFFLTHEDGGISDHDGNKLQTWPELFKDYLVRLEKLGTIRNNIVHGQIYSDVGDGKEHYFLGPPRHDSRWQLDKDPELAFQYSYTDLHRFAAAFRHVPINIRILRDALMETKEPWPEKPHDIPSPGS